MSSSKNQMRVVPREVPQYTLGMTMLEMYREGPQYIFENASLMDELFDERKTEFNTEVVEQIHLGKASLNNSKRNSK